MILGHAEIKRRCEEGLLENYEEGSIGGAGVDLRVAKFYELKTPAKLLKGERVLPEVEEIEGKQVTLQPQHYVLVETMEKVNMPDDLAAWMRQRSTLQRCGVSLETALIDPGYHGTLTFGMKNNSDRDFVIEKGARVGQIIFEEVKGESKRYEGRYQGGNVV